MHEIKQDFQSSHLILDLSSKDEITVRIGESVDGTLHLQSFGIASSFRMIYYTSKNSPISYPSMRTNAGLYHQAKDFVTLCDYLMTELATYENVFGKVTNIGEHVSRFIHALGIKSLIILSNGGSSVMMPTDNSIINTVNYEVRLHCEKLGLRFAFEW